MSWLNEIPWFLLFLLIMKVLLLWLVATWVVAVTADRPCAEYCVYLSSGIGGIDFQPECNCMYEGTEVEDNIDDSGIYYEPVDFIPVAPYIYNQPFYIFNPIIKDSQKYPINNSPIISDNLQTYLNSRKYNSNIEVKTESTHSTLNRQEKDIQLVTNQRLSVPLYLDMNVESGNGERTSITNTFTTEELEIIEQNLSKCADLYAVLRSRKSTDTSKINTPAVQQANEYSHFSDAELRKELRNKCLHIAELVENSLNEIKEARPKVTSNRFSINGEGQQNNDEYKTNKHSVCMSTTEKNAQLPVVSKNNENRNENQEHTIVLYAEPDESTSNTFKTTELPSATAAASDIDTEREVTTEVVGISIEQDSSVIPVHTENHYALHTEPTLSSRTITSEFLSSDVTSTKTSTVEQEYSENHRTDHNFKTTNVEGRSINRSQYEEGDVPLIKIITHEFSNNTVQSFINGTEDIPNGDFKDEMEPTEDNDLDSSNVSQLYQYTETTSGDFVTNTNGPKIIAPDISGNLYFLFNNHQIPARFVQNVNGSVHLGIDGASLCNELTQNGKHNSAMLTILCNCYNTGNCKQKEDN